MRAVWSHWSAPLNRKPDFFWLHQKSFLLSFALSLERARLHYPKTVLYTDDPGARLLVDGIGLRFDVVRTSLNALSADLADWWTLGKLVTYRDQTEPFVHIDYDVFLWEPLPLRLEEADVFSQNLEEYVIGESDLYDQVALEEALRAGGGWIPEEWAWHRSEHGLHQAAINCGIYGGRRLDFIHYVAEIGLDFVSHATNSRLLEAVPGKENHTVTVEQYIPWACYQYHSMAASSPFRDIRLDFLFKSFADAFETAEEVGYTHLIGSSKQNRKVLRRLEERVSRDHPDLYESCLRYLQDHDLQR